MYPRRKPGIDGGRTATLEPHELDDCHVMPRVRVDGGALTGCDGWRTLVVQTVLPGEGNFSESPSMLSRTFVSVEFHDG